MHVNPAPSLNGSGIQLERILKQGLLGDRSEDDVRAALEKRIYQEGNAPNLITRKEFIKEYKPENPLAKSYRLG